VNETSVGRCPLSRKRRPSDFFRLRLGALAALLLAAGCHRPAPAPPGAATSKGPASVTLVRPAPKDLTRKVEQPGELQAFFQAPLFARIDGYVKAVHKDIGDTVKQDEPLADLYVPERVEELKEKKALLAQAKARLEQADKLLEAAKAAVGSARARIDEAEAGQERAAAEKRRADSQYARLKSSPNVVTSDAIDEARLEAEKAQAAVKEIDAKVKSATAQHTEAVAQEARAKADVGVAKAALGVAGAAEGRAAAWLSYATLKAPFAGAVTKRTADPGHLLRAGEKGEPAFVVVRTDQLRVFVDVPEEDAALIKDGDPAEVRVAAMKGETFPGKVKRSSWALGAKDRTLRTEIDLTNPGGRLRPGMYAYATVTVERKGALAVPVAAVQTQGDRRYCFRVQGGKVVRFAVAVGVSDGKFVQFLRKREPGASKWEAVTGQEEVAANASGLSDGQAVEVAARP
jgi:RND family efflux transporter MFP subunit